MWLSFTLFLCVLCELFLCISSLLHKVCFIHFWRMNKNWIWRGSSSTTTFFSVEKGVWSFYTHHCMAMDTVRRNKTVVAGYWVLLREKIFSEWLEFYYMAIHQYIYNHACDGLKIRARNELLGTLSNYSKTAI